jgi:hypothetical protein
MKVGAVVKAAAWLHQSARHFQTSGLSCAEKSFIASFFEKKVRIRNRKFYGSYSRTFFTEEPKLRIIFKNFFN